MAWVKRYYKGNQRVYVQVDDAGELLVESANRFAMAGLATTHSLEAWKDYLRYTTLLGMSKYLPKPARDEVFAFYGKQLGGQQVPSPRWQEAILDVGGEGLPLSDPLSKLYVERYVAADARPKAKAMIDNLVAAFDARLAFDRDALRLEQDGRVMHGALACRAHRHRGWRPAGRDARPGHHLDAGR